MDEDGRRNSGNCGYGPAAGRSEAVPEGAGL